MTSFTKISIKGDPGSVVEYLQTLCSNDVNIPVGNIISTGMLNEKGLVDGHDPGLAVERRDPRRPCTNAFVLFVPLQEAMRMIAF